ncbi:hypothetical protein [Blastococcus goldschmidtiae]|uniref:DUF35 domain-containing protein n=1 Tax=Blastococcus goldschmidtiae TaxID=3075546 RepID=A0ABU2KBX7_9ACTN|nr:hypothetical protein [Blastococcus sp. DSM 46792]MDT0277677.1 hypothetical protein [Blastococcus sp. DSM 46792]
MPTPSADSFAALARSSPWRWSMLRFSVSWSGERWGTGAVRAWLSRPDRLRVEDLDGALLQVVRDAPDGDRAVPVLRPDGLVASRPAPWASGTDAPMYRNYHWVAMLDPAELADGIDPDTDLPVPGVGFGSVAEVEHGGRPAWEVVARPTPAYEPRCGCCALLRSRAVDVVEYRDHPEHVLPAYPDAYRVRLDVQTGVCVLTEELGGLAPGKGHDVRIEAVDEAMDDALFVRPRRK